MMEAHRFGRNARRGRMKFLRFGNALGCVLCLFAVAAGAARAQPAADWASQICSAGATGDCYVRLDHPAGCYFWSAGLPRKEKEPARAWSGACEDKLAQGEGTLALGGQHELALGIGAMEKGKRRGAWVVRSRDGSVQEVHYRDGKRHGPWIKRQANWGVEKGDYSDGKKHGFWVEQGPEGTVEEGPYQDGKRHGPWIERQSSGLVKEGAYRDGKKHGSWVARWPSRRDDELDDMALMSLQGLVDFMGMGRNASRDFIRAHTHIGIKMEGPYRDGKRHGRWVKRLPNGHVEEEGPYRDDKRHGPWIEQGPGGLTMKGPYRDGKRHGPWIEQGPGGLMMKGPYRDGKRHGPWVERWPGGSVEEGAYQDGKRQGPWAVRLPGGTVHEVNYRDGEPAR